MTAHFESGRARFLAQRSDTHDFRSVDSAPAGLSKRRGVGAALASQVVFALLAAAAVYAIDSWPDFLALFPSGDFIIAEVEGRSLIPIRLFMTIAFISIVIFAAGTPLQRAALWLAMMLRFAVGMILIDIVAIIVSALTATPVPAQLLVIVSGVVGFGVFAWSLLDHTASPRQHRSVASQLGQWRSLVVALLLLGVCFVLAYLIETAFLSYVLDLRGVALLGGVGPGVFLVLPLFLTFLLLGAKIDNWRARRAPFSPRLGVVIPAHNEAHCITATLLALDRAAQNYAAPVTAYVINNASTDDTSLIASSALARCVALKGSVIECPTPGKAKALNTGLGLAEEAYILRLDADSIIDKDALTPAVAHLADPEVGAVACIPYPINKRTWIERARAIEIEVKHGFYQTALSSIDGTIGLPGMCVLYRRDILVRLGGFVEGMNGEDTDISLRIGACGLRLVTETRMVCRTEVPSNLEHLREQRLRWYRSIYHVSAANRSLLLRKLSVRSLLVLPWMLLNGARRALMLPLAVFAGLCLAITPDIYVNLDLVEIAAVFLGAPALLAAIILISRGRLAALLDLPIYFAFRALRSHQTLDSALSMRLSNARAKQRQQSSTTAAY